MERIRYLFRLGRTVFSGPEPDRQAPVRGRWMALPIALSLIAMGAFGGALHTASTSDEIESLQLRTERLHTFFAAIERDAEREIAPIERVLSTYRANEPELVRQIALALVREGHRTGIEPQLLLAVLLVENPWLDPSIRNDQSGAQGLMQVMPFHAGEWKPCAPRLDEVDANICHGARIFAHYLGATNGDVDRALLRYNGCVTGSVTPNCQQYPWQVYARAGRASVMAWNTRGAASR